MDNFTIYVDKDGKMPQLRYGTEQPPQTHPYFVRYVNNRPVAVNPHPGQTQVWDYSQNRYIPVEKVNPAQVCIMPKRGQ